MFQIEKHNMVEQIALFWLVQWLDPGHFLEGLYLNLFVYRWSYRGATFLLHLL